MKAICYCILFCFLSACQEDTTVNTVSGQLFMNCEQLLPDSELAMKTNPGGTFQDPFIIGSGRTNGQGLFEFSYSLNSNDRGSGDLILISAGGFQTLISELELNRDYNLLLFKENIALLELNFSFSQPLTVNDTLFYGLEQGNIERFLIQTQDNVTDSIEVKIPNTPEGMISSRLYYGVGQEEFERSKEALGISDSTFQHLELTLYGCSQSSQLLVPIN